MAPERATAAQLGSLLDQWINGQSDRAGASPDRLQTHLADLFPSTFQARSQADPTAIEAAAEVFGKKRGSIIGRLFR